MSTTASFTDNASFEEAIKCIRSDVTDDLYVIVGHVGGDPNQLEIVASGQDTSEMAGIMDEGKFLYALARYKTQFDMSTTVKFVYFRWVGEAVPLTKKGRYGVVHGSVEERFNPYHMMIETSSREDFDDETILQQLEETCGTKSKVIDDIEGRQQRGFTASQRPQRGTANNFEVSAVPKEVFDVEVSASVYEDIDEVRNDKLPVKWIIAQYRDCNPKGPLDSYEKGEGDLSDLKACLEPDKAMYVLYRVTDIVDDITTVKFVFITWVGTDVKPMTRAKVSTHKGMSERVFGQAHVTIYANELSDITESIIMNKVRSASGTMSHVK